MRISISMTEDGEGYENQIADRLNGILKTEFGLNKILKSHEEAKFAVQLSIDAYNTKRPHLSCGYLTPIEAHFTDVTLEKKWTNNRTKRFTVQLSPSIKEEDSTQQDQ